MPASINGLIQVLLVIAWYAVPSMATLPWYIIFLPTLIPVVAVGAFLLFLLVMFIIAAIAAAF